MNDTITALLAVGYHLLDVQVIESEDGSYYTEVSYLEKGDESVTYRRII